MTDKDYRGEAKDPKVGRPRQKLETLNAQSQADCQDKANWLKRRLSGQSETLEVTLLGAEAAPGQPWQVNTLIDVDLPQVHVVGEFLIVRVQIQVNNQGTETTVQLKKVEAYQ